MSVRIAVMDRGKILQVGSPRDIYDRPADRFVADFIGDTNFLTAEVVSVTEGRAVLRLASGREVAADLPEGMVPQGRVTAVIRPEHASLAAEGELRGTLENIVYFGTDTHYHVRLPGGEAFVLRSQNLRGSAETWAEGQEVAIALRADAVQVLRD